MRTDSGSDTQLHKLQRPGSEDPAGALRDRYQRRLAELRAAPELARGEGTARVELAYGFACNVDLGDRSLRVDLPRDEGGSGSGPHPGQLMRASLSACLVMGYRTWAARLGIALEDVGLELSCEYDERGQLGIDDTLRVGWRRIHWTATLLSTASETELERVVQTAHRYSPMLANLAPEIERAFQLRVLRPERATTIANGTNDSPEPPPSSV
jgi:uncharacterized OsmC-like protein